MLSQLNGLLIFLSFIHCEELLLFELVQYGKIVHLFKKDPTTRERQWNMVFISCRDYKFNAQVHTELF